MKMISLDTETTGLDLRHGAKPFLVTTCDEKGVNTFWEWDVDPLTREPEVVYEDLNEIQEVIDDADLLVLQNPKFDYVALQQVYGGRLRWDWGKVRDTLLAGHLLESNGPHNLTDMALIYLNANIEPYEVALKKAAEAARRFARTKEGWRVAKAGLPEMPSVRGSAGSNDYWLPRAWAKEQEYPAGDPWWAVCSEYANADSTTTLALWKRQRTLLKERGLWRIYLERLKVLPVVCDIEDRGITVNRARLEELRGEYAGESARAGRVCTRIAERMGHELTLPKSGNNKSLGEFVFGKLKLDPQKRSKKTGAPSLDKAALEHWEATLPWGSRALAFVRALRGKRRRDTALSYMEGYERFWLPVTDRLGLGGMAGLRGHVDPSPGDWFVLHPSLNPTGTDTLRWSSSNPNEQNISKQEGFNLRRCFGPGPGREWWSLDAKNIELRIPAYESGEEAMVRVFDRPDEPPYYGSYHLLIADLLHPGKFEKYGAKFKDQFEATWYKWVKNGNFAVIYGAQRETADRTYHVSGAYDRIRRRFPKIAELSDRQIALANERGCVETIPDGTVDPARGYPLLCARSRWGGVSPTVPLNYHVQGTACWWMMKAMVRCHEFLQDYNADRKPEYHAYMVMQVHDELVFDFPKMEAKWPFGKRKGRPGNVGTIMEIRELMEAGGEDIGVPTPVSATYHEEHWGTGVSL